MAWLKNPGRDAETEAHMRRLADQMLAKDVDLWLTIEALPTPQARDAWRVKYPNDLASDLLKESRIY